MVNSFLKKKKQAVIQKEWPTLDSTHFLSQTLIFSNQPPLPKVTCHGNLLNLCLCSFLDDLATLGMINIAIYWLKKHNCFLEASDFLLIPTCNFSCSFSFICFIFSPVFWISFNTLLHSSTKREREKMMCLSCTFGSGLKIAS